MVYKEEVYKWFQRQATAHDRIDFLCHILHLLNSQELRFVGTCIEDLGRKDSFHLREHAVRANRLDVWPETLSLLDDDVRASIMLYLPLLQSNNPRVAEKIFHLLNFCPRNFLHYLTLDARLREEVLLIYTLASYHPAFKFEHHYYLQIHLNNIIQHLQANMVSQPVLNGPVSQSPSYPPNADNTKFIPDDAINSSQQLEMKSFRLLSSEVDLDKNSLLFEVGWSNKLTIEISRSWDECILFDEELSHLPDFKKDFPSLKSFHVSLDSLHKWCANVQRIYAYIPSGSKLKGTPVERFFAVDRPSKISPSHAYSHSADGACHSIPHNSTDTLRKTQSSRSSPTLLMKCVNSSGDMEESFDESTITKESSVLTTKSPKNGLKMVSPLSSRLELDALTGANNDKTQLPCSSTPVKSSQTVSHSTSSTLQASNEEEHDNDRTLTEDFDYPYETVLAPPKFTLDDNISSAESITEHIPFPLVGSSDNNNDLLPSVPSGVMGNHLNSSTAQGFSHYLAAPPHAQTLSNLLYSPLQPALVNRSVPPSDASANVSQEIANHLTGLNAAENLPTMFNLQTLFHIAQTFPLSFGMGNNSSGGVSSTTSNPPSSEDSPTMQPTVTTATTNNSPPLAVGSGPGPSVLRPPTNQFEFYHSAFQPSPVFPTFHLGTFPPGAAVNPHAVNRPPAMVSATLPVVPGGAGLTSNVKHGNGGMRPPMHPTARRARVSPANSQPSGSHHSAAPSIQTPQAFTSSWNNEHLNNGLRHTHHLGPPPAHLFPPPSQFTNNLFYNHLSPYISFHSPLNNLDHNVSCYNCGRQGHRGGQCPEPPASDATKDDALVDFERSDTATN